MQHKLLWTKSNLRVWSPHFDSMFELQCPFYILLTYLNIPHTWFLNYLALSCAENGYKLILWHPHGIHYLLFVWHGQGISEPKMCVGNVNAFVFAKLQCLPKVLGTHDEINEKIQILCSTNISMTIVMLEAPPPPSNNVAYCEFAMASTSSLHSSRTCDSDRIKQHCLKGERGK